MSFREAGNIPINSTGGTNADGIETNPTTATMVAELDSTQLGTVFRGGQCWLVTWIVGASTNAIWMCEQASDTALGSTSIIDRTYIQTPSGQSGQYQMMYRLTSGQRLRCRVTTAFTGFATAKISAEPLT